VFSAPQPDVTWLERPEKSVRTKPDKNPDSTVGRDLLTDDFARPVRDKVPELFLIFLK
jgi:hypothetical protein